MQPPDPDDAAAQSRREPPAAKSSSSSFFGKPGARGLGFLVAAGAVVAAFFIKGCVYESFTDFQSYGLYSVMYFPERKLAFYLWFVTLFAVAAGLLSLYLEANVSGRTLERVLGAEVSDRPFALLASVLASGLAFAQASSTLEYSPVTDDERVYLFMADLLASGRIRLPVPAESALPFLSSAFMNFDSQWTGCYLWGHPTFLVPGAVIGIPHVMNALACGVTTWCTHEFTRLVHDSRTARVATLFLAISPLFVFGSATLLALSSTTMFISLGALGYVKMLRGGRGAWVWSLVSGIAFAWSYYCRPATAPLLGVVGVHLLFMIVRTRGRLLRLVPLFAGGGLLPVAVFGGIGISLGGSLLMPLAPFAGTDPGLGVNVTVGGVVYTPLLAASNAIDGLLRLNVWALGWPASLLFPVAAFVARKPSLTDLTLALAFAAHVAFHSFYWSSGVDDVGPVYHFALVPIVAVLAARGIFACQAALGCVGQPRAARAVAAFAASMIVLATPVTWLIEIVSLDSVRARVQAPYTLLEEARIRDDAIVFYRQPREMVSWVLNPPISTPPWDDRVLFFLDRGLDNDIEFARYFPGRDGYRLVQTDDGRWAVQRLSDESVVRVGPHIWGNRAAYPRDYRPYYSALKARRPADAAPRAPARSEPRDPEAALGEDGP